MGRLLKQGATQDILYSGDMGEYQLIDVNTHIHDAHIDLDRLKFVLFVSIPRFKCVEN